MKTNGKRGLKTLVAKIRLAVPVPVSVVLVPNGHYHFLHKWYRYW